MSFHEPILITSPSSSISTTASFWNGSSYVEVRRTPESALKRPLQNWSNASRIVIIFQPMIIRLKDVVGFRIRARYILILMFAMVGNAVVFGGNFKERFIGRSWERWFERDRGRICLLKCMFNWPPGLCWEKFWQCFKKCFSNGKMEKMKGTVSIRLQIDVWESCLVVAGLKRESKFQQTYGILFVIFSWLPEHHRTMDLFAICALIKLDDGHGSIINGFGVQKATNRI